MSPTVKLQSSGWAQWNSQRWTGVFLWETPAGGSSVWQLLLPKKLGEEVLYRLHDTPTAGHLGITKTLQRVQQKYNFFFFYNNFAYMHGYNNSKLLTTGLVATRMFNSGAKAVMPEDQNHPLAPTVRRDG